MPFSELVREAQRMGFTEPDPREDLSGPGRRAQAADSGARDRPEDGYRRRCASTAWCRRALSRGAFSPRFFAAFARHDAEMLKRLRPPESRGNVLRYVGVARERAGAGGAAGMSARLIRSRAAKGSDNIIAFTTEALCPNAAGRAGPRRRRRRHRDGRLFRHLEAAALPAGMSPSLESL